MPYKVVQTIENRKICLSVIPNNWEKEGTLFWPPRSEASSMLDENSVPGKNWSNYPCIVKRTCSTYKSARKELKEMENVTDTEEEVPTVIVVDEYQQANLDLNHLMQVCEEPISVTTNENANADHISFNDVNASFLLKNDNDEVIKNQAKIMEMIQDLQITQKKILQQVAKHEVQHNEFLNKMTDYTIATTENIREGSLEDRFPPINTMEELFQLEDNLKNPVFRSKYFKNMCTLCSPGLGAKGTNICYKVIDYFFSRDLLTLMSWSGNSRDQNEKVAFKFFAQIRQIFFSVIHNADATVSQLETDNFIKTIIKNSRQRFQATLKPVSVSTPKNRKKRSNNAKSQNDAAESNIKPTANVEVQQLNDAAESNIDPTANVEVQQPTVNVDEQNKD